jgi:uncharacterized protein (DUF924 family)
MFSRVARVLPSAIRRTSLVLVGGTAVVSAVTVSAAEPARIRALSTRGGGHHPSEVVPDDVLRFWFGEESPSFRKLWFQSSKAEDEEITARFEALFDAALEGKLAHWEGEAQSALALVILLDQFGRNMFRGTAKAFAGDAMALRVSLLCIVNGWDKLLRSDFERAFLYMPLEHAESATVLELCERKMAELTSAPQFATFAKGHGDIIRKFGRYPHRNKVLGRASTPEELVYLKDAERFGQ